MTTFCGRGLIRRMVWCVRAFLPVIAPLASVSCDDPAPTRTVEAGTRAADKRPTPKAQLEAWRIMRIVKPLADDLYLMGRHPWKPAEVMARLEKNKDFLKLGQADRERYPYFSSVDEALKLYRESMFASDQAERFREDTYVLSADRRLNAARYKALDNLNATAADLHVRAAKAGDPFVSAYRQLRESWGEPPATDAPTDAPTGR
ncbi:MAG TPA: hypothetical protein VK986_15925 [Tepidisphaeraceae bacterium]|nr:hypothetical protein [Tepidisphaeraceae bacterium]